MTGQPALMERKHTPPRDVSSAPQPGLAEARNMPGRETRNAGMSGMVDVRNLQREFPDAALDPEEPWKGIAKRDAAEEARYI